MEDGAWYHYIYWTVWMYRDLYEIQVLQKAFENEVKHAQAYIFHACMHAHKHTPLSQPLGGGWGLSARAASGERSLWSFNRPGPWQTALASSACRGAKADPAEPFQLWLAACWEAEKIRGGKSKASKLLSLSLLVIIEPFTSSFHIIRTHKQTLMHTATQTLRVRLREEQR